MRRPQRSVRAQLRILIVVLLVLFPLVAASSLVTLSGQSRDVQALTLALGPAFDANGAVLQEMTESQAEWSQAVNGSAAFSRYRLKREAVETQLATLEASVARPEIGEEDRQRYAELGRSQRQAVVAWYQAAAEAEATQGEPLSARGAAEAAALDQFRLFQDANREFARLVTAQRDAARAGARSSLVIEAVLASAMTLLAMGVVLLAGRQLARSVTSPLGRLRDVVHRQRDGDLDAMAEVDRGAAEVRALAEDFNELTHANRALQEQQSEVLLMHQLTLDVARMVRSVDDLGEALRLVCVALGEGLAVDRVLLYSVDDERVVHDLEQWHRHDLAALAPLPGDLQTQVADVSDELREQTTVFVLGDFLDPAIQAVERSRRFHEATGATALMMAPVGVGERPLGVLALMLVDGPRRWHRHEVQAVLQCAGYVAQAIEHLRAADMRQLQVSRLTELDRQKNDFMGTISHELRTPLTSINGYLELLEDGDFGELSKPQLDALGVIGRNTNRLRGLIEDLLVLNRIEASGLQSAMHDVAVGDLVRGVAELLQPQAASGGVDLVVEPIAEDLCVHVDRGQLERALINLGSNAVKFTPAGGKVTVGAFAQGDQVTITVADTGIGIPLVDQARLSERFFRASNATAQAIPGTGLGLAIVRTIVEGHGGDLQIQSAEGEGTTMRIVLPTAG